MIEIRQTVNSNLMTYRGSSEEDKPMTCAPGSTFYEWDTASGYMFDGEEWLLQTSGGGGGITVGTVAQIVICLVNNGTPDPESMLTYDFLASYGDTQLVAGYTGGEVAAGLHVDLYNFSDTILNDPGLALYDFDSDQGTLTEIPDALTIDEYEGEVSYFRFTMPDVQDNEKHLALIGIPQTE